MSIRLAPEDVGEARTEPGTPDEASIVERILDAIMEQRLPPGTKLSEAALCEAFGVRRARVRRSLLRLAGRNIVELEANRGAFVARPTPEDAHDVFEARRAVEDAVVRLAALRATPEAIARLETLVATEAEAQAARDRCRAIRLSGEFHAALADAAGNRVLHGVVKELVARTSLIIGMFGGRALENCQPGEHGALLAALVARDADAAATVMRSHLLHIEAGLEIGRARSDGVDLVALFSAAEGSPPF